MRDKRRPRVDYQACPAALVVIDDMKQREPALNIQAIIDKLVIVGGWALEAERSRPPELKGSRSYWRPART